MVSKVNPLASNVPIVDENGNPTPYFQRQLLQLLSEKAVTDALATGALQKGNNLSDLVNTLTARNNLGVGLVVGFAISSGTVGTNVCTPAIAPRTGTLTKCKIITKLSSGSDLTIAIKKNGTNIFSVNPTVPHGTATGTISTFTSLTTSPLSVALDDIFTIDIISGSSTWAFTAVLEP